MAVAEKCPSLLKLSAFRLGSENTLYRPETGLLSLCFSPLWKASLETFIWKAGGSFNLNTNDHLLERLRNANEVTISSHTLSPAWTINLLETVLSLQIVRLRWNEDAEIDTVPPLNLPNLDYLLLGTPLRSKESGDSSIFFKQLNTPNLGLLRFFKLNHRDVASLPSLLDLLFPRTW